MYAGLSGPLQSTERSARSQALEPSYSPSKVLQLKTVKILAVTEGSAMRTWGGQSVVTSQKQGCMEFAGLITQHTDEEHNQERAHSQLRTELGLDETLRYQQPQHDRRR